MTEVIIFNFPQFHSEWWRHGAVLFRSFRSNLKRAFHDHNVCNYFF